MAGPLDSHLFTPTGALCTSGEITANFSSLENTECDLIWTGGEITIVNRDRTECTWNATSAGYGTFTYQVLDAGVRRK